MSGRPWNGGPHFVFQNQADLQGQFRETINDGKLVIERISDFSLLVGNQVGRKAMVVYRGNPKATVAGKPVLRHGQHLATRGEPLVKIARTNTATGKGKKNGIAAADLGELGSVGIFGPVNDVANGTIAHVDVPVHETSSSLGRGEKSGGPDVPAPNFYALVGNGFHITFHLTPLYGLRNAFS